ncbi:MFS transporter [Chryseolinea soli]|uniref:MFS transporter n=1 Tax=Chryseolinea soli TaxID=2321403 RepID=A0A385SQJ2_9BACT|nr:MFS transporter [Chryseolinea soli]AYB33254.1 MFS transporter [Chryseolinea soli]
MAFSQRLHEIRTGFSSNFWIANTLELFERMAFYGAKAVLVVFLAERVGLNEEAGTLAGIFSGLIFSLPIVAGVLVDRYGFKKTLMACFFIFCIGYFLIGLAGMQYGESIVNVVGKKAYALSVLILTAVGGSLIKPCIVGTVAKTTKPEAKALGFSVYYTMANIGGAIGPIVALYVREDWGIEYVLIMSSFTSFLLFLGAWFFYREPVDHSNEVVEKRTLGKVFADMLLVFANFRFMIFLVIFSGIWIMFWQIFYLIPFYARTVLDFKAFEWFETVDAAGIILLTVPMAALVKEWKPITAMTLGFIFASFAWILIGTVPTVWATVAGIALYALGEATQAPRFYEYVSNLAPRGQTGTYMGFAFLPVAIGSFSAGAVSDWLRLNYLDTNPALMWYIVAGIGFTSTTLMILYNLYLAPKPQES